MSRSFDSRKSAHDNSDDPNVIQLGFNISVTGKSGSDFEVYVNDKKQSCGQLSIPNVEQKTSLTENLESQEVSGLTGAVSRERFPLDKLSECEKLAVKGSSRHKNEKSPSTAASGETESSKSSRDEDVRIIDEIKNAMGNFEKFSEHLKEIPRLSTKGMYTSTPFPDKHNSRSEGNLSLYGNVPRSCIPKHDFRDRKYFKKSKPVSNDLFLKPLPAEDYFKKGFIRRYYDVESYHHYASMESLPHYYEYGSEWKNVGKAAAKSDNDKSDGLSSASDVCTSETKAVSKKGDENEVVDKQSTSSESTKDIKIYQSGGIIIMQNFKDGADLMDRDLVDGSKLLENCNRLKEKIENSLRSSDESQKLLLNSSSDDVKGQSTKFVQFDLPSFEYNRSKSCDSSSDMPKNEYGESLKNEMSNTRSELSKGKDSGLIFPSNQEFTSLSTQENDSIISNLLGMSPTSSTSGKKLEWDSGADVGYLNMDLTKENISTIERIILKGLNDDGTSKKKVIYQITEQDTASRPSKFILERMPSELEIEMKNSSTSKCSSSDQSSAPSGIANISTTNSRSLDNAARVCVSEKQQNTECKGTRIEKHRTQSTDKTKKPKHSKKSKLVKNNQDTKLLKSGKNFDEGKEKDTSTDFKATNEEEKFVQTPKVDANKEIIQSSDKSTYVNTLFDDLCFELPILDLSRSEESGRSESSDKLEQYLVSSPRMKKLRKKKSVVQGSKLSGRPIKTIETATDIAKGMNETNEKWKPKASITPSAAIDSNHNAVDEKRQEIEELKDDHENEKCDPTPQSSLEKANQKDKVARSRPISASSSSVRTVMHNVDATENPKVVSEVKNFSDQIIQTCELMYESKGIQAFQSAKCSAASSKLGDSSTRNLEEIFLNISGVEILREEAGRRSGLTCSKSIQAPGMNSSLPKHLAHPKQTISHEQMNTKSTQYFGSSITSLPNYHSNVPLKESIVRKDKILKSKVNSNIENYRIKQENEKNGAAVKSKEMKVVIENAHNKNSKPSDDGTDLQQKKFSKGPKANKKIVEDKENLSLDEEILTDCSVRQSNCSQKELKTNCSVNSGSKKSDSLAFGSCDVFPSDDGKNLFLTSELLKEHGDRIDRNIIQEKYFQSQLLELERREMVSKTTSMEKKSEQERNTQTSFSPVTGVSVSCQYSPSLIVGSEEILVYSKTDSGKSSEENRAKNTWTVQHCRDEYDSSQKQKSGKLLNTMEALAGDEFLLVETLSSDTQTANSWVPGERQSPENQVGRTLSVEYLSEHIYDDPASINEKSPNRDVMNLHLGDSVQSNGNHSTSATCSRVKNSESGHTLVLENTDRSPLESDRVKSLNNNLTELELVVSKLHEKEAIFQKITDSVLSTMSKVNGSGDSSHNQKDRSQSNVNSNETEEISGEVEVLEESIKSNGSIEKNRGVKGKSQVINEISIACQTDTMKPDQSRLDEERKLEQRMNNEKQQQIRWIESEIKHLNMLRSLLEEQGDVKNTKKRKKRHHYLTEATEGKSTSATLKEEILRKILTDSLSKTSSATEVDSRDRSKLEPPSLTLSEDSSSKALKQFSGSFASTSQCPQLGMAFSLRKIDNAREVTMLPVGIQVTLRDRKERSKAGHSPRNIRDSLNSEQSGNRVKETPTVSTMEFGRQSGTQPSSLNNQYISTTPTVGSIDSMNRCGCYKCSKSKCVCLKTSESSDRHRSSRGSSPQSKTREPAGINSAILSGELPTQALKIPEIRGIADSRRVSTNETPSGEVTRSSKQEQFCMSSEESLSFEKCICICHAQPLSRCDSCQLLNTCKKCQCYRRIKCCLCEISAPKVSVRKKCQTISTSCHCKVDSCQKCRCSRVKSQICSISPCHAKAAPVVPTCKCKKMYKERSCQTEGNECKCCQCDEPLVDESDLYRETKYMSEQQHITEKRKPSDVVYPMESRYECESKKPVEEKFSYEMKVPVEKKNSADVKNATQTRTALEQLNSEKYQTLPFKELQGTKQCSCNSRQTRKKSFEDHPRHYFLQVEETSEEESSESGENRNALEVITIKVPIRKICNGGRNMQSSSPQRNSWKTKENGDIGRKYSEQKTRGVSECNCCEDCAGYSRKRSSIEERPRTADYSPQRASYESKKRQVRDKDPCKCCADCPGHAKLEDRSRPEFALCDDYEQRKTKSMSYTKFKALDVNDCIRDCCNAKNSKPLKYPSDEYRYQERGTDVSDVCNCCDCCCKVDDSARYSFQNYSSGFREGEASGFSSTTKRESVSPPRVKEKDQPPEGKKEKNGAGKSKGDKCKRESDKTQKVRRKSPSPAKPSRPHNASKTVKVSDQEKNKEKCKSNDYYNFNKKEYMTKSELEREKKKRPTRLTLQECLTVKRPDLYTRAECRRKIIAEKCKDRVERHNKRMECLAKLLPQCDVPAKNPDLKLFTSAQMKKQTRRFYRKLPEVANKKAEEKKKMQFRTNKLMAEIFAKKLQLQTLKGRLNMSNSFTVIDPQNSCGL